MIHPLRLFIAALALCAISASAISQTTYKCGNAYSETPCVDGKAVAAGDKRTDEQKRQADDTTSRQKIAASGFKKDRIAQEKRDALELRQADQAVILGKPKPEARKVSKLAPSKPLKSHKPPQPAKPIKAAKKKKVVKSAEQ